MDWSKIIEQSIALLFPLIIVFLFVYYMLKSFFDQFEKQRKQEIQRKFIKETIPLRFQAYERIILLLERIKPESMIMRSVKGDTTTAELQRSLLENIRNEFEHNLSQQIYISEEAWTMVITARQSMIQLVGSVAIAIDPTQPYMEYATDLLEEFASTNNDPVTLAINFVQKEAKELM